MQHVVLHFGVYLGEERIRRVTWRVNGMDCVEYSHFAFRVIGVKSFLKL